jgi:sugar-phosphatase
MAASGLRVPPSECLVIEDAPAGIEAARSAGMTVVGLTTTHLPKELMADACTGSLAGVHLRRIGRSSSGERSMELLVLDL